MTFIKCQNAAYEKRIEIQEKPMELCGTLQAIYIYAETAL